ncbi:MAG TPA: hypothetical protein PKE19_12525 [Aestuariivirga sp.]|nr:hypothetical protein [Aestuariivirga sp.]
MTPLVRLSSTAPRDRAEPRHQSPLSHRSREPFPVAGQGALRDLQRLPGDIRQRPQPWSAQP